MRIVVLIFAFISAFALTGCRTPPPSAQTDAPITPNINPFPFSRWEGLEADGDSVRLEFNNSHVTFFKRRPGTPCWVHRGEVPFEVVDGILKTTVLDADRSCLPYEYNGGVLVFPSFSGDWSVWHRVGQFRTETTPCP